MRDLQLRPDLGPELLEVLRNLVEVLLVELIPIMSPDAEDLHLRDLVDLAVREAPGMYGGVGIPRIRIVMVIGLDVEMKKHVGVRRRPGHIRPAVAALVKGRFVDVPVHRVRRRLPARLKSFYIFLDCVAHASGHHRVELASVASHLLIT